MPKFKFFLKHWLPVLLWLALIFGFSSDAESYQHSSRIFEPLLRWLFPQMPAARVEELHHLLRKGCHLTEYAMLALLLWRAIRHSRGSRKNETRNWQWDEAGLALAGVFLFAAGDEFHQIFVPTRTARVADVLIDTTGGALALFLLWFVRRTLKRA